MSEHTANVVWSRNGHEFAYQKYSRDHEWKFDGGAVVQASASPAYMGGEANVDPEEAFIASLSACHMLTFLALCTKEKLTVESYDDEAVGVLEKDGDGKMSVTRVTLRPRIVFSGGDPSPETLDKLHHDSHEMCFIASSVKTEITVEPV
ncbi:MAG: OsmC family protein [Armatimonadota bacterium]|nr:OsmC family protein [Armatimonadota bacterium]